MKKNILRKSVAVLAVAAMTFSLAACGGGGSDESEARELVIAHTVGPTNAYVKGLEYCYEEYDSIGDGTLTFNEQGAGALGTERTITEGILNGDIDIGVISDHGLGSFYGNLYFGSVPGVFENYDDVEENYRNGWGYEEITSTLEENGLVVLGIFNNGFRWLSNDKEEITSSDQLKNLKIRVPEVDFMVDLYEGMGALPVTISNNELASALQQGVADGQELGPQSAYNNSVYEFQKYWTETNAGYSGAIVIMNADIFNSLSERQQEDLIAAFGEGADRQFEYSVDYVYECWDNMEAAGCVLSEPSEELLDKYAEVGKELAFSDKYSAIFGEDLLNNMFPEGN